MTDNIVPGGLGDTKSGSRVVVSSISENNDVSIQHDEN